MTHNRLPNSRYAVRRATIYGQMVTISYHATRTVATICAWIDNVVMHKNSWVDTL